MSDQEISHDPVTPGEEPQPAEGTTYQPELPIDDTAEGTTNQPENDELDDANQLEDVVSEPDPT